MNKLVNSYLNQLEFQVKFELDEQFNEKIKSRYRDEFAYANFSEGEKMRIDLASALYMETGGQDEEQHQYQSTNTWWDIW